MRHKEEMGMLQINEQQVYQLLFKGNFGLEKEGLRVTSQGRFSHTAHPFSKESGVVRDFSENQTEINTGVSDSAHGAIVELRELTKKLYQDMNKLNPKEYIWPFSNPPYIENEADIPIAQFYGDEQVKTVYRQYLAQRYGRYKMTFCGIHVNFSFAKELVMASCKAAGRDDYQEYTNELYLDLAQKLAVYGWIVTALTAASPIMDRSFVEKKVKGKTLFLGMSSVRCSELGYWNFFTPIFDYSSLEKYAYSMQKYLDEGLIAYMSELYYPVRLKPKGINTLEGLREHGIDHIELRMVDLNPYVYEGIDERDLKFIHLFLIYLASLPKIQLKQKDQVQAAQNFKNAAHYDLKTVNIVMPDGKTQPAADAGLELLLQMQEVYKTCDSQTREIIEFEKEKFITPEKRYAWRLFKQLKEGYEQEGLRIARQRQEES
ncbi:hypothetical protein [Eubacterium oxidoreducens]|uniref:Glutamate--cysteine ligase n=1 Tax=Eubacterium oxidoreducens TaxID=1732 RepID=A0A1G6CQK9_EUBOX|nr:hypothetical protein [Eubacterium oxidoreducens]SDB35181.1 glutamate--cysteine ligase [Eubacterium oxidoreducens]